MIWGDASDAKEKWDSWKQLWLYFGQTECGTVITAFVASFLTFF